MTVQELIRELNKIPNKNLPVVANIGLDFCDRQQAEEITYITETEEYFGKIESGNWVKKDRQCVKLD